MQEDVVTTKYWRKCSSPERSRIHPEWFDLYYYLSEHGIFCLSEECDDSRSCSLGGADSIIAQYSTDAKVQYSLDNGKTKQTMELSAIPSKIEFITLLIQEKIELLGRERTTT